MTEKEWRRKKDSSLITFSAYLVPERFYEDKRSKRQKAQNSRSFDLS